MLAIDANFKLKRKNRKTKDYALSEGWAYFVDNEKYTQHISHFQDELEVRPSVFHSSIKRTHRSFR